MTVDRVVAALVLLCLAIAFALIASCSHPAPPRAALEIYVQPKTATPWCQLDDPPKPPELRDITSDQAPDVIDRVMVHRRELRELQDYLALVELWQQQTNVCLGKLTE